MLQNKNQNNMKKIYALCVALLVCALLKAQTNNLTLLGYLDYAPYSVAGVWQYVDTAGNEYAIVGAENRLSNFPAPSRGLCREGRPPAPTAPRWL